jgi:hypothetical protein
MKQIKPTVVIDCRSGIVKWEGVNEKTINDFYSKQVSVLKNKNKKFEISPNFYDAAMLELEESFRYGECRGMMVFFKEEEEKFYGNEFYDTEWLRENNYGFPCPIKPSIIKFSWNFKKLNQVAKGKNDLVIISDVIPYIAFPFYDDMQRSPICKIITGFERKSDELEKLISETFYIKPKLGKRVNTRDFDGANNGFYSYYQMPFDFSEEAWNSVIEKSRPTIRLSYSNEESKIVPLYLNGKKLE